MLKIGPESRDNYNRESERYPWKTHGQWLRAAYGLTMCCLMIIFQDWQSLVSPVSVQSFVASYISVSMDVISNSDIADNLAGLDLCGSQQHLLSIQQRHFSKELVCRRYEARGPGLEGDWSNRG